MMHQTSFINLRMCLINLSSFVLLYFCIKYDNLGDILIFRENVHVFCPYYSPLSMALSPSALNLEISNSPRVVNLPQKSQLQVTGIYKSSDIEPLVSKQTLMNSET